MTEPRTKPDSDDFDEEAKIFSSDMNKVDEPEKESFTEEATHNRRDFDEDAKILSSDKIKVDEPEKESFTEEATHKGLIQLAINKLNEWSPK